MTKTKEEYIKELMEDGMLLEKVPETYKKDKEVIYAAL